MIMITMPLNCLHIQMQFYDIVYFQNQIELVQFSAAIALGPLLLLLI